jgi:transketolase
MNPSQRSKSLPVKDLEKKAFHMRQLIYKTITHSRGGHIPASLSIVEILTVLYHGVLNLNPKVPNDPLRDRFILSKGHGSAALYAALCQRGFLSEDYLTTFGRRGGMLGGHPDMHKVKGVEASTGSLGHGLAFASGVALAAKIDGNPHWTYALLGDGECQEGSVWEAALFAAQHKLNRLVCIVDFNKLQAMGRLDEIVGLAPLAEKWRSFGWAVEEVDGNDLNALIAAFSKIPFSDERPSMIAAHTIKGKGISFMERVPIWHYRMPNREEDIIAQKELGLWNEDPG